MIDLRTAAADETATALAHPGSGPVPTRHMDFARQLSDLPRYFAADGDIVMSHILAVLSGVFPDGEDYFVRSVDAVRDRVTDAGLAADVDGFIGQESMHGREHRMLNQRLAEFGYPTRAIGRYVRAGSSLRERFTGPKVNLGFTAALEHYTATLAETLLGDPEARGQIGHPGVRHLLMWHALEESEHKSVAFDLYRAVGGTEAMRQVTMWITHATFVLETGIWTMVSLTRDPYARRHPWAVLRSIWKLRTSPFTKPDPVRRLFQYHRRGFHPTDRNTTEMIAEWRANLFGPAGNLREVLERPPAPVS